MNHLSNDAVADLLLSHIPREFILSAEEGLFAGAKRGFAASLGTHDGHRASALGQMRAFKMNEEFSNALATHGANPSPIRGNALVTGKLGIFTVGRFNISAGLWNNGRRSRTRLEMSYANRVVEPLVQPNLFGEVEPISKATVFIVASFSGSLKIQPETPLGIDIAVPDKDMKGWLFREPLQVFLNRYHAVVEQKDTAIPTLKVQIKVEES
jgi:hypothetical protein